MLQELAAVEATRAAEELEATAAADVEATHNVESEVSELRKAVAVATAECACRAAAVTTKAQEAAAAAAFYVQMTQLLNELTGN